MSSFVEPMKERIGARLTRVCRLFYAVGAELTSAGGDVELRFSDGEALVVGCDPAHDTLTVRRGPWLDPMEPLTEENAEYVAQHGRWLVVDVSTTVGLDQGGDEIVGVDVVKWEEGEIPYRDDSDPLPNGVKELGIVTERNRLVIVVGADQIWEVRTEPSTSGSVG